MMRAVALMRAHALTAAARQHASSALMMMPPSASLNLLRCTCAAASSAAGSTRGLATHAGGGRRQQHAQRSQRSSESSRAPRTQQTAQHDSRTRATLAHQSADALPLEDQFADDDADFTEDFADSADPSTTAADAADDDAPALETGDEPRFTKSLHRLPSAGVKALKSRPAPRSRHDSPLPSLDIPLALATILELVERPTSAVEVAMSLTPGISRPLKPVPVPVSVQVATLDNLIDSFDPTLDRARREGDTATLAAHQQRRADMVTVEEFLHGRQVVVERGKQGFELGDSQFSETKESGPLDPNVLHTVALVGKSESALAKGRTAAVQLSLSELMDVAAKYHERALEHTESMHSVLASPLAPRAMPNVSARSESADRLKSRQLKELEAIFEVIEARAHPTAFHYTLMLNAYAREGFVGDAERLFSDMLKSREDAIPYKRANFFPDTTACNSMLAMYDRTMRTYVRSHRAQAEQYTEAARGVIRTMTQQHVEKDARTYTAMIALLCNQLPYATVERSQALLKESLELFEFMQTPRAGSVIPSRRTYAVLVQAFSLAGDHTAAHTLVARMMKQDSKFPNYALMNGWLKSAAFACAKDLPLVTSGDSKSKQAKPDLTPVQSVISLMKTLHLPPTEHSVVSVMKGLASAGHVASALDLHDRLDQGSLGSARPSKKTYTALLSHLIHDHAVPMATILERWDRALADERVGFKDPVKRKGSLLDLRSVGNHPELYSIVLTKQLHHMLREYMRLHAEARADAITSKQHRRNHSNSSGADERQFTPAQTERRILDQICPARGWLVLTGRHAGDKDISVDPESGHILPQGYEHSSAEIASMLLGGGASGSLPGTHDQELEDQFPDEGDYSAYDDTGLLAAEKRLLRKDKRRHPLLPGKIRAPSTRMKSALNTVTTLGAATSYAKVAEKFLLAQTPSLATTHMKQFAKEQPKPQTTEWEQAARREAAEREAREQEEDARAHGAAAPFSSGAGASHSSSSAASVAASSSSSSKSIPAVAPDATPEAPYGFSRRGEPLQGPRGWIPFSLRPPEVERKNETNEGVLIVRRPVLHFWLQCHAYVLRWHQEARESRDAIDAALADATAASARASAHGAAVSSSPAALPVPSSASAPTIRVPRPSFLSRDQSDGWWSRLAESIELQHGLARLQSSFDAQQREQEAKEARERFHAWKRTHAWQLTTREGEAVASGRKQRAQEEQRQTDASADAKAVRAPASQWSVRQSKLQPQQQPRKRTKSKLVAR